MRRFLLMIVALLLLGLQVSLANPQEPATLQSNGGDLIVSDVIPARDSEGISGFATITVIFNRPVVPLGSVADMADLPQPLTISPEIDGQGDWINTSIYVFTPDIAWGNNTQYTVTVDAGLEAVDGSVLEEPFTWSFTTTPLEVIDVVPDSGETGVVLNRRLQMVFNMPVDQDSVEDVFYLAPVDDLDATVSGSFDWNEDGDGFMFMPTDELLLETEYEAGLLSNDLRVADTTGTPANLVFTWRFTTVPFPAITGSDPFDGEENATNSGGVRVFFASPMDPASFTDRITIEPEPSIEPELYFQDWDNALRVSFPLDVSTPYTVTLDAGSEDPYGNTIDDPFTFSFVTAPARPDIMLRVPGPVGFYDAGRDQTQLFLTHRNVSYLDLELHAVPLDRFAELSLRDEYGAASNYRPEESSLLRRWRIESIAPEDTTRFELLNLDEGIGEFNQIACEGAPPARVKPGDMAVVITEPDPVRARTAPVDGEIIDLLYKDYALPIEGGPVCAEEILWWEVRLRDGETAWVAEGVTEEYFIDVQSAAQTQVVTIPNVTEDGRLQPGIYFLEVSSPETLSQGRDPMRHFIVLADANLVMKLSIDSATIWATDPHTGQPIPDAPLTIYDQEYNAIGDGTTDANGIARIDIPRQIDLYQPILAVMDDGETFGAALSSWTDGIDPWRFGVSTNFYPQQYSVYMYTDRPIYRPDQPVYFRGVVRNKDDVTYTLPDMATVPVTIYDDQGEAIYERDLPLTSFGTFSDSFMLADDAPLGYYRVAVELPSDHPWQAEGGSVYFSVAEYRLPEFQVEAIADTEEVLQDETISVTVDSTYFFGGRVTDAVVDYNVIARAYSFRYEGTGRRYDFTDYNPDGGPGEFYGSSAGLIASGTGRTDDEGRFVVEVPADLEDATQSQTFTIEATVRDESDQVVSARAEVVVHQGLVYLGARPKSYVSTAEQETELEFIAVDWEGDAVADQAINVEIIERRWSNVQEEDPGGRTIWSWEVEEIPVEETSVTTDENGQASITFVPPNGGIFKVTITGMDDAGNEVRSSTTFWVSSRQYVSWRQQNSNRIDLVTGSTNYEVGDTAEILITSPFQGEAEAFITVERGDVLLAERVTLTSNSYVYELPILPEFTPNVFVSVMLVKGVDENNPTAGFRMGATLLNVDNSRKIITIDAQPNVEQAGPGDDVTYTVRTTDYIGDPVVAEVGVGLTDLASLSIADPNSGPILDYFYGQQQLAIRTATVLTINTDQITQTILDTIKGGGGGFGEGGIFDIREEFVDTAYWQADLVTDDNGEAEFTVTLPDNLTTWRLDVRAITSGEDGDMLVGMDTFDLLSTKPLLIRPVTPRFFVVDDVVNVLAVVNNNTEEDQVVEVFVEADGLRFQGDSASHIVNIAAGGRARVVWPVTVENVDSIDMTFFARSEDNRYTDASKPPLGQGENNLLPVYRFEVPETVGTGGVLREADTRVEGVAIPENVIAGDLTLRIEPSLAAASLDALEVLRAYPFEHIEGTISRFLPNVMTWRALDAAGRATADLYDALDREVQLAVQRLAAQQKIDGGWGWYVQDESNPLVTAYAFIGLVEARDSGFVVDQRMIDRARDYLQTQFITPNINTPTWRLDRQVFMLYALSTDGAADIGRTVTLFDRRERLSIYSKALLVMAFNRIGDNEGRIETLVSDIANDAILSANGAHWEEDRRDFYNWNTNTRTTALVLRALVTVAPENDLIPNVVRWLMVARTADVWETSQETAWAVMALTDWMVASDELNGDFDWSLALNGEELLASDVTPDTVTQAEQLKLDVAELLTEPINELSISRGDGDGNLYYTAYLRNLLPVPEVEALDRGIIVERRYVLLDDPTGGSIDSARVGDVVQVRLTIIAPNDLHYVIVEDPIPAGVEPINPQLRTSQQIGTRPGLDSRNPLSRGWGWWWFSNIQFRDEKIVLNSTYLPAGTYEYVYTFRPGLQGVYNVIPPTAYETYFPDVYGRGDGSTFTVLPADS